MRPIVVDITTYTAVVGAVAAAQAVTAGTPMTLAATPFVNQTPRELQLTFAGNETGNRFSVRGTGARGNEQYDVIDGANATTASSRRVFGSILSITPLNDGAGNVSADTAAVVRSPWIPLDYVIPESTLAFHFYLTGTLAAGATVEATVSPLGWHGDNPLPAGVHHGSVFDIQDEITDFQDVTVEIFGSATLTANANGDSAIIGNPTAVRLVSNEVLTAGESIRLRIVQGHPSPRG